MDLRWKASINQIFVFPVTMKEDLLLYSNLKNKIREEVRIVFLISFG
jgi:hypothetical protein